MPRTAAVASLARSTPGLALLAAAASLTFAPRAEAAPPWVRRHVVLPRHDFAFDAGLGIGHVDRGDNADDVNGVGLNLEGAFGITERLELGFRTGLRFGNEGRIAGADYYARLWDTDTYNVGTDTVANPEARLRYGLLGGDVVELGLEARFWLPLADNTGFGVAPGLPVMFHFGDVARLDTGLLVPILFDDNDNANDDTVTIISIPARLWFQASERLWLGPVSGVRIVNPGNDTQVPLGFGLGYQISSAVDFKSQFLFPDVARDGATDAFGVGAGVQFRVE
jgi:hypothetical protein